MISFSKLGNHGRLGNQLFQYAFLRTQAEKLGVTFYCPKWTGDEIFDLDDKHIRAEKPEGIHKTYIESHQKNCTRETLTIDDNTDITGHFESEKKFNTIQAKSWFSFEKEKVAKVDEKYKKIDFRNSIGLHLRLGDKYLCDDTYTPRISYYINAIKKIGSHNKSILVFSDDMNIAKIYFSKIKAEITFMENNEDWEDLYLMSKCTDFACGASTLSWWGAWLNSNPNKKIIFPKEGTRRPGFYKSKDLIPSEWIKIRALRPIIDNYIMITMIRQSWYYIGRIGNYLRHNYPSIYKSLKPYFPNKK